MNLQKNIISQNQSYSRIFKNIPFIIFTLVGLVTILNHSMWRDELNVWMVARDSHSLSELYQNVIPEGHPILWYWILYIAKSFINDPIVMQVLHWFLGTLSVFFIYYFSPFLRWQKILICFGYFLFYEYFIISRNYVLVGLLLFLFCTIYPLKQKTLIPFALILGALSNSHAYALFISISLTIISILKIPENVKQNKEKYRILYFIDIAVSAVIFIVLTGFSVRTLMLAGESSDISLFSINIPYFLEALGNILGAYTFIVPSSKSLIDLSLGGISIAIIVISFAIFFRQKSPAFIFYIASTLLILFFSYSVHLGGGSRHQGFYYLILVAAMWIFESKEQKNKQTSKKNILFKTYISHLFSLIIIIHFSVGIVLFVNHLFIPFSASKATVEFLEDQKIDHEFIVASPDTSMAPIAGYLNRSLYYPEIGKKGTFTHWRSRLDVSKKDIFLQIENLFNNSDYAILNHRILLILNTPLEYSEIQSLRLDFSLIIEPIENFENSWHSTERYYVYWLKKMNT